MFKKMMFTVCLFFANGFALACDFSDAANFAKMMHPNYIFDEISSSKVVVDYQEIEIYLADFRDVSPTGFTHFCSRVIVCDPNNNTYQLKQMSCRGMTN